MQHNNEAEQHMTTSMKRWRERPGLREWLSVLASRGELRQLSSPVDPDQEVGAVLEACDGRSAILFTDVMGASMPLVGNTVTARQHYAVALGCGLKDVVDRITAATERPRACTTVQRDVPLLANHQQGGDLLGDLPLPVQHEHDAGRYFTSAVLLVRDPRTGATNLSINRLQVTGPDEVRALLLPGRLRAILTEHENRGEDLPVALCVGVDPIISLASQAPHQAALDDLEVASGLYDQPLNVVSIPDHPVPAPAGTEMVLVGRFRAGERAAEGPFGEYPLTYGPGGPAPVIQLTDRWHRDDPIVQTILSGGREHFWIGGLPREARLLTGLRGAGLKPAAARLTEAGSCRMHAVVSLTDAKRGAARHAAMAVFATLAPVKLVVVVDDDIDVFDDEQVGWAVATRMQADRDLLVVAPTVGGGLDPSADGAVTAKLGIDATAPPAQRENFARMRTRVSGSPRLQELLESLEPAQP